MTDTAGPGHTGGQATSVRYGERLYVPWWGWPLPLIAATILAAEIHMGYPGVRSWLPYVLLIPATAAVLVGISRTRVAVQDGELCVGKAHLPLRFVGEVEVFATADKRRTLGPNLDHRAFLLHRGWVGPLVRVTLTDPDDPAPHWVFSCRTPEKLVEALRAG